MTTELVARVARRLDALAPAECTCVIAVSGGPDSLALLDLLHLGADQHGRSLVVAHVDHGLHPESQIVAGAVAAAARARGIPFVSRRLALPPHASETAARAARRTALREMMVEHRAAAIVLAHHADDQVETVLLRMLRGSGPNGLAAMSARRGPWLRPLLGITRAQLAEHLVARGIEAWQDPANSDPRHLRSWLRAVVLPPLRERLPDLDHRLLGLARQAAAARRAWDDIPMLLSGLGPERTAGAISVAAAPLRGYRSAVQDAVIAALGRRFGVPLGARRVAAVRRLLEAGASGRVVHLSRGLQAELSFDRLIMARPPAPAFATTAIPEQGAIISGPHRLRAWLAPATTPPARQGTVTALVRDEYAARPWRRGDRIRPYGGTGSRAVSVLLKEARVAASRRDSWPVIVAAADDATILWVPGICRSAGAIPDPGEEALHVECDLA